MKLKDKNIRVNKNMVVFFQRESNNLPRQPSTTSTETSINTSTATSSKLNVAEYSVFVQGKFTRLSGRHVRPMTAKPGFYRVLFCGSKYIIHMNLVLPIVWNFDRNEEMVIAPTHFRVLVESGEFIIPAECVRPDQGSSNIFIIRLDNTQNIRIKSSLLFPMWLNGETMCTLDQVRVQSKKLLSHVNIANLRLTVKSMLPINE